jgi:integrase
VRRVLEQPADGKTLWTAKPETASRLRGRIERVLDWAHVHGYRDGPNPARWKGNLAHLLPSKRKVRAVRHHSALDYRSIPKFMNELRQRPATAARALEFLILTAARTGEVIGARWSEFNLDEKIWTVPAVRMKAGRVHRVPLSPRVLEILTDVKPDDVSADNFVFTGPAPDQPLSNTAMLMLLRRMGRGDLTSHGFRSSFRDWAAERTDFPSELAEMALAHTVSSKVEAAYRRGDMFDKRRNLMETWGTYCATGVTG